MTPAEAYAFAVAAVQADGEEMEDFAAEADDQAVQDCALSWCFAPTDNSPGSFFVHVHADGAVTFSTLPFEGDGDGCAVVMDWTTAPTQEVVKGTLAENAEARRELARRALAGDQETRYAMDAFRSCHPVGTIRRGGRATRT